MPASQIAQAPGWRLERFVARDRSATLDLERPATGIVVPGPTGDDHLLALDVHARSVETVPLVDHWLRGDDVVAVYRPNDPRRLEATALWRRLPGERRAWELVLSAQTALVESDGSLAVTCDVASGAIRIGRMRDGQLQWHPFDGATAFPDDATNLLVDRVDDTVLVAVHPSDARRIVVSSKGGRAHVACWLFSAAIEKGVLHRGRVLAAIGPKDSSGWASMLISELAESPPPLAT